MIATGTVSTVSLNNIFPSTAVSDAFEAVTNGMHNPEALAVLAAETSESPEWISLINAIQAFYSQDFDQMSRLLDSVPDDTVAGSLKRVLRFMSGTGAEVDKLGYREEKLAKRVTEDSRFLVSAVEQLRESMEYGEELFVETVSLLIKEVKNSPEAAERLALWSFNTCIEREFDDEALADNIMMIFGQAEGLRLIGLSLIETEPESALICFTRSLIKRIIDKTINEADAAAFLEIIGALLSACTEDDPVLIDISEMLSMLESELSLLFGFTQRIKPSTPAERVAALLGLLTGGEKAETPAASVTPEVTAEPADPAVQTEPKGRKQTEAVQLELF